MSKNKNSNGCLMFGSAALMFIVLISIINKCNSNKNVEYDNNYKTYTGYENIENTVIRKHQWRNADDKLISISKIMIANNISGCGEFYISEITSNEFAVACTSDGSNWTYYVVYPSLDKIYLANDKMIFEPPY